MRLQTIVLTAAALAFSTALSVSAQQTVQVQLHDGKGNSVGTADLSPAPQGVNLHLNLVNLSPGQHGIHIHSAAKCDPPSFTTAGAHFNPDSKQHGLDNPAGPHAGDIPNITVDRRGHMRGTVVATGVTMGDGNNSIFSNGGTALVIHAKADDNKTDPSGNSGDRIACGVITKP